MAGLALPKPIPLPTFIPDSSGGTYTSIFNEEAAQLPADADMGAALTALSAVSDAFGVELLADQGIGPLSTLFLPGAVLDPVTLDGSIGNYVAAGPTGDTIIQTLGSIQEPQLLTLPLTPGDGSTNFLPVGQTTHDFGTVKLNSAPITLPVGRFTETALSGDVGDSSIGFVIQAAPFTEYFNYRDNAAGTETFVDFGIIMTPLAVGDYTAQFEWIQGANRQLIILTLHVTVTP